MTHHNKGNGGNNKNSENKVLDELAIKEGLDSPKVDDYSQVEQGVDSVPNLSEQAIDLNEAGEVAKGKKDKEGKRADKEAKKSLKEKIRCSNCSNLMTQSEKMNYHEIPGKIKIPQAAKGKAAFKGVGVAQGRIGGVLCDTCQNAMDKGIPVTIRTAVVERADTGEVENMPVSNLLSAGAETAAAAAAATT
jgi:hypothetical protein